MNTNLEELKTILEKKEIKPTYQRLKILEYLEKNRVHPTVETIYENVAREVPTISRTTVYNTLHTLMDKELVVQLTIPGLETRFDVNKSWHHHFLCEKCGKIIDLHLNCEQLAKGEVQGHKIKELHGYFKGVCRDCLAQQKQNEG